MFVFFQVLFFPDYPSPADIALVNILSPWQPFRIFVIVACRDAANGTHLVMGVPSVIAYPRLAFE
jgi:hypothetical protein